MERWRQGSQDANEKPVLTRGDQISDFEDSGGIVSVEEEAKVLARV